MFTKYIHNKLIYSRRMHRLAEVISVALEDSHNILDVGCGDGKIDLYLMQKNPALKITGIDVLVRPETYIDVIKYDGYHIPLKDNAVDTVMIIDVLHHVDEPALLMKELARVCSSTIIIKDHIKSGPFSYVKLRLMDYVGNAHYHVRLPYNYLTKKEWKGLFQDNRLTILNCKTNLNLYSGIFHLFFDRNLHFIAKLHKAL